MTLSRCKGPPRGGEGLRERQHGSQSATIMLASETLLAAHGLSEQTDSIALPCLSKWSKPLMPAACGVHSASHQGTQDFRMRSAGRSVETKLRHLRGRLVATAAPAVTCGLLKPGRCVPGIGTLRQTCKNFSRFLPEGLCPRLPHRPCNRAWPLDCSSRAGRTTEASKYAARTAHLLPGAPRRASPGLANNQALWPPPSPSPFSPPQGSAQAPPPHSPKGLPHASHRWRVQRKGQCSRSPL